MSVDRFQRVVFEVLAVQSTGNVADLTTDTRAGLGHAQAVSAQAVVQAAGDRASRFRGVRANGRPRPLDHNAAAGEKSI